MMRVGKIEKKKYKKIKYRKMFKVKYYIIVKEKRTQIDFKGGFMRVKKI